MTYAEFLKAAEAWRPPSEEDPRTKALDKAFKGMSWTDAAMIGIGLLCAACEDLDLDPGLALASLMIEQKDAR